MLYVYLKYIILRIYIFFILSLEKVNDLYCLTAYGIYLYFFFFLLVNSIKVLLRKDYIENK